MGFNLPLSGLADKQDSFLSSDRYTPKNYKNHLPGFQSPIFSLR